MILTLEILQGLKKNHRMSDEKFDRWAETKGYFFFFYFRCFTVGSWI